MNKNKAIKMIDEYLIEPNSIPREWVECLRFCQECINKVDKLTAYVESLERMLDNKEAGER